MTDSAPSDDRSWRPAAFIMIPVTFLFAPTEARPQASGRGH
jgi:hypothetical protein